MKADLLRARDMKRYINQLTVAKKQCEKRIRLLGGPNYENNEEGGGDDSDEPQSQKVRLLQCGMWCSWCGPHLKRNLWLMVCALDQNISFMFCVFLSHIQILQFDDILCNPGYREHFRVYMEKVDKRALISFWELVETLKTANKVTFTHIPEGLAQQSRQFVVLVG